MSFLEFIYQVIVIFVYGEANGAIHFHALMYIPKGEMIGELVSA